MNKSDKEKIAILETKIDQVLQELKNIRYDMNQRREEVENRFVTKDEFKPVKKLTYGAAGLILSLVITALIYLVITA